MTAADIGGWVRDRLGVFLHTVASPVGLSLADLLGVAVRQNPRRAHLLVSTVLGKHIPVDPRTVHGTGLLLGALVGAALSGRPVPGEWATAARRELEGDAGALIEVLSGSEPCACAPLVLGFAETATGLGHSVATALAAPYYLHSTRRPVPGIPVAGTFEEGHSHASTHLLEPEPTSVLEQQVPLVLVDDEFSTGRTLMATIRELHQQFPRPHYLVAALVDLRSPHARAEMATFAADLGIRIDVVSLVAGEVELPDGILQSAQALLAELPAPTDIGSAVPAAVSRIELPWPASTPDGGRHGILTSDQAAFEQATATCVVALSEHLHGRVLLLGTEELMYLPHMIGVGLSALGHDVRYQTTTRSPVFPVASGDYPVRRRLAFADPEGDTSVGRYLNNALWPDGAEADIVVVVVDGPADTARLFQPDGLATRLAGYGVPVLVAAVTGADPLALAASRQFADPDHPLGDLMTEPLPEPLRGPEFGSYPADEVGWLITDLSHVDLEADVAEREKKIQAGTAHYAESLPVEFQPGPEYRRLFDTVLAGTAERLAEAVGLVTELVLAERGPNSVLVSLARAGTPVGILMRRWAAAVHGIELPHYAVSIVRGRGIDEVALKYLAAHHDPSDVVFVDGWTGKGAIAKELTEALAAYHAAGGPQFNDDLAVLADPGSCVRTFGTRDDFLIASACLNSTVSGLVSRTVLNDAYIGPHQFHGAKFYAELAEADMSNVFLDAVTAAFPAVRDRVATELPSLQAADRAPTWAGWAAVDRIRESYGIESVNFVKPGVGETTRVLLRRMPWRVLVRDLTEPDHAHIRLLAAERGVPVDLVPDLPYSCVGLIQRLKSKDSGDMP